MSYSMAKLTLHDELPCTVDRHPAFSTLGVLRREPSQKTFHAARLRRANPSRSCCSCQLLLPRLIPPTLPSSPLLFFPPCPKAESFYSMDVKLQLASYHSIGSCCAEKC